MSVTCRHGREIAPGLRCPQCEAEKKLTNGARARRKQVAQRQACPSCHRRAALQPVTIEGKVVKLKCRWCGREITRKKSGKR